MPCKIVAVLFITALSANAMPQTQNGKIVFFTDAGWVRNGPEPTVFCDGVELGKIGATGSLEVVASPGRHGCAAESPDDPVTEIAVRSGGSAYVRVDFTQTVLPHAFLTATTESEYRGQKGPAETADFPPVDMLASPFRGQGPTSKIKEGEVAESRASFDTQTAETSRSVSRYSPPNPDLYLMDITVAKSDLGDRYHLRIDFTVPSAKYLANANLITIYGFQTQGGTRSSSPSDTFPSVRGNWKAGDRVTFQVDLPKKFSDPSQGWSLAFCVGSANTCIPSRSLLTGEPLPPMQRFGPSAIWLPDPDLVRRAYAACTSARSSPESYASQAYCVIDYMASNGAPMDAVNFAREFARQFKSTDEVVVMSDLRNIGSADLVTVLHTVSMKKSLVLIEYGPDTPDVRDPGNVENEIEQQGWYVNLKNTYAKVYVMPHQRVRNGWLDVEQQNDGTLRHIAVYPVVVGDGVHDGKFAGNAFFAWDFDESGGLLGPRYVGYPTAATSNSAW